MLSAPMWVLKTHQMQRYSILPLKQLNRTSAWNQEGQRRGRRRVARVVWSWSKQASWVLDILAWEWTQGLPFDGHWTKMKCWIGWWWFMVHDILMWTPKTIILLIYLLPSPLTSLSLCQCILMWLLSLRLHVILTFFSHSDLWNVSAWPSSTGALTMAQTLWVLECILI